MRPTSQQILEIFPSLSAEFMRVLAATDLSHVVVVQLTGENLDFQDITMEELRAHKVWAENPKLGRGIATIRAAKEVPILILGAGEALLVSVKPAAPETMN